MEERRAGGQGGLRGHLHSAVIFPCHSETWLLCHIFGFCQRNSLSTFPGSFPVVTCSQRTDFKTAALSCPCWPPHGPPLPWKSEYHRQGPLNRTLRTSGHSSLSQVSSVVGFKNYISAQTPPQVEPLWEYKLDMCLICLNYFYFD